jgi:WD40 repeat protein/TPR repeat protein
LSPAQYLRFSALLDEVIELSAAEREERLTTLEQTEPALAPMVRAFFASREACAADGFLETHGPFAEEIASLTRDEPALIGKQFGPYRVLSLLGHGGMGSVWLAERADGLFTRQVALKLIHSTLTGRVMTERFAREREILAGLNHPHIARLLDAGFSDDNLPYLALEYIAGTPLSTYCDEHRLSIRARLELFRQVLSAVQYAHAHLVIHRDLKPSNILVSEDGEIHLLDFGIAKLLIVGEAKVTDLTQRAGLAMTPDYASPEQITGSAITIAADVYALGVMLYELMTGERPYRLRRDTRSALEEAILQTDPVPPSRAALREAAANARATTANKLARTLKGDIDTIVLKSLQKAPAQRYATAIAFGEDIERFLRGDVVLAQRDNVAYRTIKFARRYRVAIAVISMVILTLAGGLAATTYEAHVAATQRDAALQAQLRSLTQTAAARLKDADSPGAMGIILEVLPRPETTARSFTPEALNVFHEARAADAAVLAITGHTGAVRFAAFSPDGTRIVTASADKSARIWDAATGRQLQLLSGHTDRVFCAAFSPDGRQIVTASDDKSARVWDAATGRQLQLLSGHSERVNSAAFSPDGKQIVTASWDKTVRLWDAATGRQIQLLSGHADRVWSAAFSPDGRRVVTASFDKTARIWDAATGRQLLLLSGHTDQVESAAYSPDGRQIVTASDDKSVRIWDAQTGRQLLPLSGHTSWVFSAAFSPDGTQIVTASFDKSARIWDVATGRQLQLLSGHADWVASAAFSPDGKRVVTASNDRTARIWDAAMGRQALLLSGHSDIVNSAAFSPDGRQIVTASNDKTARVWDAATGRQQLLLSGHTAQVPVAAFSPNGRQVVTASYDKSARIWDVATGRQLQMLSGHTAQVVFASFSPDGRQIVTASYDKSARIWDAATGRELQMLSGHTNSVLFATFSPDGRQIVTASWDKTARIWDSATGRQLQLLSGHTDLVDSARFSRDGKQILTASADKSARIWDTATGRQLLLLSGHSDVVDSASFSRDGKQIVTASFDRTARIWDAKTGRQLLLLSGHTDRLESAAFSPDGRQLVTASDDGSARIWQVRVPTLETQIEWAEAAQFDLLPAAERFKLGLPAAAHVRQWAAGRSKCDEAAAAPYDPERRAAGILPDEIVADTALAACAKQNASGDDARSTYQRGRAQAAGGNMAAAKQAFEQALAAGYPAAAVDLGMLDPPRAIALFEQAWNKGVAMAGFEIGSLYEHGAPGLAPDESRAWFWYQKAADAGEPNALARLAARAESFSVSAEDAAKKNSSLLEAFKYYAAASERARMEDWPDGTWRNWRYRRASLARLLEREGMIQEVADTYEGMLRQYAPPARTIWRPLAASVRKESK